ncbi:hypothetical protein PENSPDRAFT_737912 [Peniophora sp. CONT]|nr:hypothetical protein PENSPDRAFT_737912 [Peniophora sp. CONT]
MTTANDATPTTSIDTLDNLLKTLESTLEAERAALNAIIEADHVISLARSDAELALYDAEDALLRAADPVLMARVAEMIEIMIYGDDDMSDTERGMGDFPEVLEKVLALRRRLGLPVEGESEN